ncbi:MAG TPA: hypothetical protein VKB57_27090 [Acidimicrobiales bacterium]|nr:hypothetical protein [Acidimicrobiales bacterium]
MTHTLESRTAIVHWAGGAAEVDVVDALDEAALRRVPMTPQVADVATFLAGDGAAAITGTIVNVTAGLVLR